MARHKIGRKMKRVINWVLVVSASTICGAGIWQIVQEGSFSPFLLVAVGLVLIFLLALFNWKTSS